MEGLLSHGRKFSKIRLYMTIPVLIALATILCTWQRFELGYMVYYPIVILAAVLAGFPAGIFATILTCISAMFLMPVIIHEPFHLMSLNWVAMAIFVFNCLLISKLAVDMRRANEHMLGMVQDITELKNKELALKNMTDKFNALLAATPDCLIIINQDGRITYANAMTTTVFGYHVEEIIGKKIEYLIPHRYVAIHEKHRHDYFVNPRPRPMGKGLNLYGKHKDGHEFAVEVSLNPVETEEGLLVLSAVRDITERKKIEDAKAMLSALVESSDEAIIGKDLRGTIFSWNEAATILYGYTDTEMIGKNIKKLFPKEQQSEFDDILDNIAHGNHIKHKESLRVHKDGHLIPVSITISPIKNAEGKIIGASTTARDITQQKIQEEKLRHLAEHDALTGLINRTIFDDRLEQAIALTKRQHNNMAVCFLDLDDFKQVNDHYGHATGDLLLCAVTKRIQKNIRQVDTFARLGGDEFALILLNIAEEHEVIHIAQKLLQKCSKKYIIEKKSITITLSIGISLYPKDEETFLLEKADAAMYYVKTHGKNNFKQYDNSLQIKTI